jgi:hypothetical protein
MDKKRFEKMLYRWLYKLAHGLFLKRVESWDSHKRYQVAKDGILEEIFLSLSPDLDSLCFTKEQFEDFSEKYSKELEEHGGDSFCLIKQKNEYHVGAVYVTPNGLIRARGYLRGQLRLYGRSFFIIIPQSAS